MERSLISITSHSEDREQDYQQHKAGDVVLQSLFGVILGRARQKEQGAEDKQNNPNCQQHFSILLSDPRKSGIAYRQRAV